MTWTVAGRGGKWIVHTDASVDVGIGVARPNDLRSWSIFGKGNLQIALHRIFAVALAAFGLGPNLRNGEGDDIDRKRIFRQQSSLDQRFQQIVRCYLSGDDLLNLSHQLF